MKRLILPVLLAAGLLLSTQGYAQEATKLESNFSIQLTESMLQQKFIQLDVSGLQFKDEVAAQKFFKSIGNNLVEFSLNYSTKTATMVLFPERLGKFTWTLEDWNNYVGNMSTRCSTTYSSYLNQ